MPGWIAGAMIGGDLLGGLFGSSAQKSANKMNMKLNRENRDWMEKMSGSEMQRRVEDLKAAGLNPMLATSQGGASSPSNTAAKVEPVDQLAKSVTSASGKAAAVLDMQQRIANIGQTNATAQNTRADTVIKNVTGSNAMAMQMWQMTQMEADIRSKLEQLNLTKAQREQIEKLLPELYKQAGFTSQIQEHQVGTAAAEKKLKEYQLPSAKAEADVWEALGAAGRGANVGANALQQIISIIRSLK